LIAVDERRRTPDDEADDDDANLDPDERAEDVDPMLAKEKTRISKAL
jgi:hypothetical protein|tara:strand:+ start:239 stop:379 length:141 start_codon:yes stop_codon:yes gene_type:complete